MTSRNDWLLAGGVLSAFASLLHFGCILGGPSWYRFFGAGEKMATLAARGSVRPALITAVIATILGVFALYGVSGAGLIPPLPLLRIGLAAISAIYLARGMAFPIMRKVRPDLSVTFLALSSVIVLVFGLVYAVGTWMLWTQPYPK